MIDILLILIVAAVTWSVASEGAWGAVLVLFCVVFAGMIATNYFEPLAVILEKSLPKKAEWRMRADYFAFMALFAGFTFLFRLITDQLIPDLLEMHPLVYDIIRWVVAAVTGYATMAILLTSIHLTALPREFVGFKPERQNFLGADSPDRRWLGFMQYTSEKIFRNGENGPIFDGTEYAIRQGENPRVWSSFIIRYASRRENAKLYSSSVSTPGLQPPASPATGAPPAQRKFKPGGPGF